MSVVDLFQIGSSGTRAYQAAMGAIGDNIANTNTEGYSRRSVIIQESSASTATSIFEKGGASFAGVDIGRIQRYTDDYLDAATRATANALGGVDQRARWMTDIQTALNDGPLGVGQRMGGMFSSIEKLAANPTDTTLRTDVLFSLEQVNTAFKQSRTDLVTVQQGIGSAANNEVSTLNDSIKQLATANEGLRRVVAGSPAQAQLMDSRDNALVGISKELNVTISFDGKGVASVDYAGTALVNNITPHTVAVTQASDGTLNYTVDGSAVTAPTTGALGGLAQSAVTARDRIADLDTLAARYVKDVNDWHKQGQTADGTAGGDLLSIGSDASSLAVLVSDPAKIAAASTSGVSNGNLVAAAAIRGTGSMEDDWTQIVSSHGNVAAATLAEQTAASARDQQAQGARADVSGVNLDREAADLLRLQQAYQGCARVIQVAKELTDAIFAIF